MGPVVILALPGNPDAARAAEGVRPRLEKDFGVAAIDLDGELDLSDVKAEWAIVFGGDGAILSASRRMGQRPIPTVGVNFGRLGFLTEVEYAQLGDAIDRVRDGKVHVRERMRLVAQVGKERFTALNDVVVNATEAGHLFRVSVKIQGRDAMRYAGDGVVIATPTGSTAYSLAAGGPIIDPELKATVITPLAAHALSQRPIVIPSNQLIELYLREGDPAGLVLVDGRRVSKIEGKERLRIRQATHPFLIMRVGLRSYYGRLRRILGWGGQPRYSG
ncbi:MAG: NAD(+)/NADH kinase [Planctomycetota bacterium]|jgi:NAD+ kinase